MTLEGSSLKGKFEKHKPLAHFFIKTLGILIAFYLLKSLHHWLIDPESILYSPSIENLDIYSRFANTITYPSKIFLGFLGYETSILRRVITIPGFRGVEIQAPCMGFDIFATFVTLILAYPSSIKFKIKLGYIILGLLSIHLLNILRVSALLLRNVYSSDMVINHHNLYNFVVYGLVLLMFYFWIRLSSKRKSVYI